MMMRNLMTGVTLVLVATAAAVFLDAPSRAEAVHMVPAPTADEDVAAAPGRETAVLAGGCFWGVQGVFQHVKGVHNAVSGYAGGEKSTADYETVSGGNSGHAESVRITYDPHEISYGRLLRIYFAVVHNPTELNRQGPDVGTQYRSAIFPQNSGQARIAAAYIDEINQAHTFAQPLATKVETGRNFFPAEAHHQDYLTLHPLQSYIAYNDIPKVENLKAAFPESWREEPVLVAKGPATN